MVKRSLKKIKRKKNKKIKKNLNEWKPKVWKNKKLNKVGISSCWQRLIKYWWQKKYTWNISKLLSRKSAVNTDIFSFLNAILTIDFSAFRFKSWKFHGRKKWKETERASRKAFTSTSCTTVAKWYFEASSKAKTDKIWISWSHRYKNWTNNGSAYQEKWRNWGNFCQ